MPVRICTRRQRTPRWHGNTNMMLDLVRNKRSPRSQGNRLCPGTKTLKARRSKRGRIIRKTIRQHATIIPTRLVYRAKQGHPITSPPCPRNGPWALL
jgi:hypothetical protein